MASVVGVDVGTLNTVIAVARNRGVDVVSGPAIPHAVGKRRDQTANLPRLPMRCRIVLLRMLVHPASRFAEYNADRIDIGLWLDSDRRAGL